jgi:AraC-like DNA-binding protein
LSASGIVVAVSAPKPRLTVRAIRPLVSGLKESGYDATRIAGAIGIDEATLNNPDGRVPTSVAMSLLALAVEETGDDNIGLHLAERASLGSFDVHFYAMASSPTLGAAFERLCRYQRLIHDASRVELEVSNERVVLRHDMGAGRVAPRQTAEFLLTAWVRAGRTVTGIDWAPQRVHFAHVAPPDLSEHERFFRADLHFAMGENALVLARSLLEMPCVGADAALVAVLDRYAADRLEKAPQSNLVSDRARNVLREELRGGEPTAARLAARLKMSVRSLNRLLAGEATSFRELLDALRRDLAARYLAGDDMAISEISFLLGFAELSSFHRAFKRWTGRTPAEFRQQVRSGHN